MKPQVLLLVIFVLTTCSIPSVTVRVENVEQDTSHPNVGYVKGMVRNLSDRPIKGAVKIKFLNSNGDVVHSNRAFVNDGDPIQPDQAANFSYATEPEYFNDVVDFEITFYER